MHNTREGSSPVRRRKFGLEPVDFNPLSRAPRASSLMRQPAGFTAALACSNQRDMSGMHQIEQPLVKPTGQPRQRNATAPPGRSAPRAPRNFEPSPGATAKAHHPVSPGRNNRCPDLAYEQSRPPRFAKLSASGQGYPLQGTAAKVATTVSARTGHVEDFTCERRQMNTGTPVSDRTALCAPLWQSPRPRRQSAISAARGQ